MAIYTLTFPTVYSACVDADINQRVTVGTAPAVDKGALVAYDNLAKRWWVDTGVGTIVAAASTYVAGTTRGGTSTTAYTQSFAELGSTLKKKSVLGTIVISRSTIQGIAIVPITLSGIQSGSDIVVTVSGTSTQLEESMNISGTTYSYKYPVPDIPNHPYVDFGVFKTGYVPFFIRNYPLSTAKQMLPVSQVLDRNYIA